MKNSSNFVFVQSKVKKERDSFVRRKCEFVGFFRRKGRTIICRLESNHNHRNRSTIHDIFFPVEILINDIGIGCLTRFIVLFASNFERERLTRSSRNTFLKCTINYQSYWVISHFKQFSILKKFSFHILYSEIHKFLSFSCTFILNP